MGQPRQTLRMRAGKADGRDHKTRRLVREPREATRCRRPQVQLIGGAGQKRLGPLLALLLTLQALGGCVGRWHRLGDTPCRPECPDHQSERKDRREAHRKRGGSPWLSDSGAGHAVAHRIKRRIKRAGGLAQSVGASTSDRRTRNAPRPGQTVRSSPDVFKAIAFRGSIRDGMCGNPIVLIRRDQS